MGNHGARVVRFRDLRQTTFSLSYGKTIHSDEGPQEHSISRILRFLVHWRVLLSEFRFLIHHIPGVQNVVADGLTPVMSLSSVEIPASKRHMFIEDRIFRLGGEG